MTYLLAVGDAIRLGYEDCQKMLDGKGISFWPGKTPVNVTLYYQDWLRLLLFILPRSTLLNRTGGQLAKILPGPCYTRLKAVVVYNGRSTSIIGGYQE